MDTLKVVEDSFLVAEEKLKSSPQTTHLHLECPSLDDTEWLSLSKYFNEELTTLNAIRIRITDNTLITILKKCRLIQYLKFIDCVELTGNCISHIGTFLDHLKTIHFEYTTGATWPSNVDVLSVLVKNCTSDLNAISFVGFNSVTDVGVCYAAECYTRSLLSLDLSNCPQVSDRALLGVADWSKLIKQVNFNGTSISDKSLQQIAAKSKRLKKVDFGNCDRVSDKGVKTIAELLSPTLEEINVENCLRVSDAALYSVIYNCAQIKVLKFDGTSISDIPPHILSLKKLKRISFIGCKKLSDSMGNVSEDVALEKLFEKYKGYYLPYRLRVFFLGESGAGKSSLLKSLKSGEPCRCPKSTLGTNVSHWNPLKQEPKGTRKRSDESKLLMECYDVSGSKLTESIPSVFFTNQSLYVVVFNAAKPDSVRNVLRQVKHIQSKAPGSRIVVIGTHGDSITTETADSIKSDVLVSIGDAEKNWCRNIQYEITSLRELGCDLKFQHRIEELDALLKVRPRFPKVVHIVSNTSGMELLNAKESLLSAALDYNQFSHLGRSLKPATVEVLQLVYQLRDQGQLIIEWEYLSDLVIKPAGLVNCTEVLDSVIRHLHDVGIVLDLHFVEYIGSIQTSHHLVCLNPPLLADTMCLIHRDLKSSNEKLDIKRFWPKGQNISRPDPGVLVKSMEEISTKGVIRQSIVPLLLQKYVVCEDQILLFIDLLQRLGFLAEIQDQDLEESTAEILLHDFPNLSFTVKYKLCLFQLPIAHRPHIHWNSKPHKGDIQVNWSYQFPNGKQSGSLQRLLSRCYLTAGQLQAHYTHCWPTGLLCRIGESFICIEEDNHQLSLCCRTLADDPGQENICVQYMWAQLAPFVYVAEILLSSWTGLFYKRQLTAFGNALHGGVVILREKPVSVLRCIDLTQKAEMMTFQDDGMSRYVDIPLLFPYDFTLFLDVISWICHLVENRDTITSIVDDGDDYTVDTRVSQWTKQRTKIKSILIMGKNGKQTRKKSNQKSIHFGQDVTYIEHKSYTALPIPPTPVSDNEGSDTESTGNESTKNIDIHPQTKNDLNFQDRVTTQESLDTDSELHGSLANMNDLCGSLTDINDLHGSMSDINDLEVEGTGQLYSSLSPEYFSQPNITDYRTLEGRNGWQVVKLCIDLLVPGNRSVSITPIVKRQMGTQTDMTEDWENYLFRNIAGKLVANVVLKAVVQVSREQRHRKSKEKISIERKNDSNNRRQQKLPSPERNIPLQTQQTTSDKKLTYNCCNSVSQEDSPSSKITNGHPNKKSDKKTKVCVIL